MLQRLNQLRHSERGLAFVYVGLGFMAFLAATTLAIDVGMFMTARSQAQNSADAGALAGATALAFNSYTDRSSSGPAVQGAINASLANQVMTGNVSVNPSDVSFPLDPNGINDRVKVDVSRTQERNNAVPTLVGAFFGVKKVDITATATAEAAPANAETCVLPFTIPDKWVEHVDGTCTADGSWTMTSSYNIAKTQGQNQNQGAACSNPDVYYPPGSANPTGYGQADWGTQVILKANNQNKVAPSMYNPWDIPGGTGGNYYRDNIADCNTTVMQFGDWMTPETGNMTGPTSQGIQALLDKDPGAQWDPNCKCVTGSAFSTSPRVTRIPLYNPDVYAQGQQTGKSQPQLKISNYLGIFVVGVDGGGNVTGYIVPITGMIKGNGNNANGAFPRDIRLVQ